MTDVSGFEGVEMPSFTEGEDGFGGDASYALEAFDDMDVSGVKGSDLENRALSIDKAGLYHLGMVATPQYDKYKKDKNNNVDMTRPAWPGIHIRLTVLATSPGLSPVGSVMHHELKLAGRGGGPIEDWARKQTNAFLVGCGILKVNGDQVIDPETGTTKVKSSTIAARLAAVGQIIGKVEMSKPTDQYPEPRAEFNWGKGVYPVNSPIVAHVPKNLEAIKSAGIEMPAAGAGPKVNL